LIRIGVIGCGYWGPNLIRNFSHLKGSDVVICSDLSEERLAHMRSLYPKLETTTDYRRVLAHKDVDAVVVATPPETHCKLAIEALRDNTEQHELCKRAGIVEVRTGRLAALAGPNPVLEVPWRTFQPRPRAGRRIRRRYLQR